MPFDWILLGLLTVVLLLALWLTLRRADTTSADALRVELQRIERDLRDEVSRSAAGTRQELAQTLATFQQTLLAQQGNVARTQNEQIDSFRTQLAATSQSQGDTLARVSEQQGLAFARLSEQQALALKRFADTLTEQLRALAQSNDQRMAEVRQTVEQKLGAIQLDNEKKLEQMRATVDEKLHATLEARLGESFKQVADRLEQVHKGLGEMQLLAKDVGSLQRVLNNVKTRGVFGEVQLAGLLEQVFTPEQYATNVETVPGSNARVEFAIRLPGRRDDGAPLWLPIDAKFPREDYERLLDAQERADPVAVEASAKAIETRFRIEARSIRDKYVAPPHTTDFAILFVPTEGLYAEALRRPGLLEALQREHKVMLAGPTTLLATLTSLQMGFRTLVLEKRSAEVWEKLGAVKTEFGKFGTVLSRAREQTASVLKTLDAADVRTRQMTRALKDVESLPDEQAQAVLPGSFSDANAAEDS